MEENLSMLMLHLYQEWVSLTLNTLKYVQKIKLTFSIEQLLLHCHHQDYYSTKEFFAFQR